MDQLQVSIDENSIFYLMSRGLNHHQSKELLTNGFLLKLLKKLQNMKLKI